MSDQFNDSTLIALARETYFAQPEMKSDPRLEELFSKVKLTNIERNHLLTYTFRNRKTQLSRGVMKKKIFALIGYTSNNEWQSTVSRPELEAILNWIMEKAKK